MNSSEDKRSFKRKKPFVNNGFRKPMQQEPRSRISHPQPPSAAKRPNNNTDFNKPQPELQQQQRNTNASSLESILKGKVIKEFVPMAQKEQKKEFENIYTSCLGGTDFEFIDEHSLNKTKYKLVNDLLMIYSGFYKIYLPTCMIGLLLSFTHLLGHKGLNRMMCDMESYYFEKKYTICKRFIRSCYACFLSHKSSRRSKLGVYPLPTRAMQEVSVDLFTSNILSFSVVLSCIQGNSSNELKNSAGNSFCTTFSRI